MPSLLNPHLASRIFALLTRLCGTSDRILTTAMAEYDA
jgi:hypothetical protein